MVFQATIVHVNAILGEGTTWANEMDCVMNHVPGAGLINRSYFVLVVIGYMEHMKGWLRRWIRDHWVWGSIPATPVMCKVLGKL